MVRLHTFINLYCWKRNMWSKEIYVTFTFSILLVMQINQFNYKLKVFILFLVVSSFFWTKWIICNLIFLCECECIGLVLTEYIYWKWIIFLEEHLHTFYIFFCDSTHFVYEWKFIYFVNGIIQDLLCVCNVMVFCIYKLHISISILLICSIIFAILGDIL